LESFLLARKHFRRHENVDVLARLFFGSDCCALHRELRLIMRGMRVCSCTESRIKGKTGY